MSYTALYRKWRPARFEDVRGQDHIVQTIRNQLASGHIGHAYLFTGTRGVGKTTMAKILARAVNCEHPVNGSPCNECPSCRAILSGNSVNVVEIDAASNNGVDNIREIREEVRYKPTEGKYRVYIIDEVHMLSAGAFNAILKTLEEPPEYVIFILATTEVQKIPVTVLSRCQRYDFRRLSLEELKQQLNELLQAENVQADEEAVTYLARQADGSSRDALSLLERCISFGAGEVLTYDRVLDVLGAVDQTVFSKVLRAVLKGDVRETIDSVDEILASGREVTRFVTEFIQYLRNALLVQTENPSEAVLGISKENMARLREEARQMEIPEVMRFIRIQSALLNEIRFSTSRRTLLELALIKMMMPAMESDEESLRDRIRFLEEKVNELSKGQIRFEEAPAMKPLPEKTVAPAAKIEVPEATYEEYKQIRNDWKDILFALKSPLMRALLQGTTFVPGEEGKWTVLFKDKFYYNSFENQNFIADLTEELKKKYGKEFAITSRLLEAAEAAPQVVLGSRIPGIEMEIKEEGEPI